MFRDGLSLLTMYKYTPPVGDSRSGMILEQMCLWFTAKLGFYSIIIMENTNMIESELRTFVKTLFPLYKQFFKKQ